MATKIFSLLSLIASIVAFVITAGFHTYRVDCSQPLLPTIMLMLGTFLMILVCTFNYYHVVTSSATEEDEEETDENVPTSKS